MTVGARAGPAATFIKGVVPINSGASISHIDALIALFDESVTPANYLTVRQATPAVTAKPVAIAAAAAAAVGATNSCPPLDSVTTVDTGCVLALELSSQTAVSTTQLALLRPPQPTSVITPEGRSSGPAPTSEPPPSPPRPPSPTPVERGQLREEAWEDCCVSYEDLAVPMVRLGICPHRLHLPCYAALRVRAGTNLRCPACRTTVTVNEADRMTSRQHSNAGYARDIVSCAARDAS